MNSPIVTLNDYNLQYNNIEYVIYLNLFHIITIFTILGFILGYFIGKYNQSSLTPNITINNTGNQINNEPEHVEPEHVEPEPLEPEHVEPEHVEPESIEPIRNQNSRKPWSEQENAELLRRYHSRVGTIYQMCAKFAREYNRESFHNIPNGHEKRYKAVADHLRLLRKLQRNRREHAT